MSETEDKTVFQRRKPALPDAANRVQKDGSARQQAPSAPADPGQTKVGNTIVAARAVSASATATVKVGQVLKQRFELTALLGAGGMGAVYKARDLRQVEAGDQSPWVALKVINETFARHEHALITLQQETKKTQRLAHPNIVSVYDFDRAGDVAFMTMELLDGQSLDALMARKPAGLPMSEALDIVRQICLAVEHAHRQGIVHADLKPANIFLASDGRVKILDFGIAQAMQSDGNFDAQILNALTPAYASVRMLAGQRPQAADDLYALGCITYLLLTGKHPYNRKRATEADAAGLRPVRIKGLNLRQWRALERLLRFEGAESLRIEAFQRQFFSDQDNRVRRLYQRVGAAALVILVLAISINVWLNRNVRQLATQLTAPDIVAVRQAEKNIQALSGSDQVVVLERARDAIAERIGQQLPTLKTAQDFRDMDEYLRVIGGLYPDSSRVQDSVQQFQQLRTGFVSNLAGQLQLRIEQRNFGRAPVAFASQVMDLRQVAPDHGLLEQTNLKTRLAKEASVAVYLGQHDNARDILDQADLLFPEDTARFQQIRARLQRAVPRDVVVPAPATSVTDASALLRARELLQQMEPLNQPGQVAEFVQALSRVDMSLHVVMRQGLKDFLAHQQQQGNGKAFADLQQALFGQAPVLAVAQSTTRKIDPCPLRLANLGKQRGFRCRDSLSSSETGPELVVVNRPGVPAFAISRTEISVSEFNLYCRLYRRCTLRPPSNLPVTDIDLQQAQHYARWLSQMTGYRYRLPTLPEWQAAARDDSGVSDHNCVVNVAGRIVRGNSLRPVDQGYANSLGLVNVLGNAEEWVKSGANVQVMGGAANLDISRCRPDYRNEQAPESADAFRGLRLVRELAGR